MKDPDAIKLSALIDGIIEESLLHSRNWNIYEELLIKKPTSNGQIVGDNYYIEQLKKIGQKLIK